MKNRSTKVGKFRLGQDPQREEAGQRIAYYHMNAVKRRRLERAIDLAQVRKRHRDWAAEDEENLVQLEKDLEAAVRDWKSVCLKWLRSSEEHRRVYKGEPRMILTEEQNQYLKESLKLPELYPSSDGLEPILRDAIIIGISRADEVLERSAYDEGLSSYSRHR